MLRNYFKIAFRNLIRNKLLSLINILGLTIGIASCLLILLYILDEIKYDKYHSDSEDVYRIVPQSIKTGERWANLPGIMQPIIASQIPEIEEAVRLRLYHECVLSIGENHYVQKNFVLADSSVFNIFSWELIVGNPQTALNEPNSVLISENVVKKYFGDTDPIGKIIEFDHEFKFTVTGVFKNIPEHSFLKFDFLGSLYSLSEINSYELNSWNNQGMGIYLKFYNKINKDTLQEKIKTCVLSNEGERYSEVTFQLQPLRDIYLHSSDVSRDIGKHGNILNVYGFAIVALLILIIACFNYINLTTARANSRAKEVGVRKAIGANRSKLAFQFLGESFFTTLISFLIALILVEIMVQPFNELLDKNLNLYSIPGWQLFFIILIAILIISVFAGSFPAFILSRFQAIKVLKGITSNYENKSILSKAVQLFSRRSLVVFQFAVAVALIIASNIVYNQLELIRTMDLGVKTDHLVVIENPWDSVMTRRYDNFKISISNNPDIHKVSAAFNVPPGYINNYARTKLSDNSEDQDYHVGIISVDYNYFETIGAEILEGRNFNSKLSSDEEKVCIINETAAKLIGLSNPVGKSLTGFYDDSKKEIIGIVKDIYFTSIHEKVDPVVFFVQRDGYPPYSPKIIVKTGSLNIKSTIKFLEDEWNKLAPQWPFQYYFMDQKFEKMYRSEQNISKLMQIFTFLAILISFSGLFGLMLFIVESRTKEIGIRKVFGASVNKILYNLMKEFFKLILIANLFAWPVIYIIMDKWLQNFEYQAGIKLITFVIAGLLTLLIAFATVFYQSLKTANSNPVDSLKYE